MTSSGHLWRLPQLVLSDYFTKEVPLKSYTDPEDPTRKIAGLRTVNAVRIASTAAGIFFGVLFGGFLFNVEVVRSHAWPVALIKTPIAVFLYFFHDYTLLPLVASWVMRCEQVERRQREATGSGENEVETERSHLLNRDGLRERSLILSRPRREGVDALEWETGVDSGLLVTHPTV